MSLWTETRGTQYKRVMYSLHLNSSTCPISNNNESSERPECLESQYTNSLCSSFSETTAAQAEAEAPNLLVAKEVESNAEHVQDAAVQAASVAKVSIYISRVGCKYTCDRLWARNTRESPPLPSISSSTMHQRRQIKPSKRESTASRLQRRWVQATWIKQRHLPLRPSRRCKYVMQIGACWIVVDDVDIRNIFLPLLVASTRILLRLEGCQEDMSALQRKLTRKKTSVPREPRRHRPQVFLPQTRLRRATPTRVPTL